MIEVGSTTFWRATTALCLGSFLVFASLYISHPLMPLLSREFLLSPLQASWSLSLPMLTLGLSLLIWGPLSDAVGRRLIMILTLAAAIICGGLQAGVDSYSELLSLRALQGFFLGGLPAVAIAWFGDEFSKKALLLAVGFYISGNSLGGVSGRLFGGLVADLSSWQQAFSGLALISAAGLLLFAWLLPESRHFSPRPLHIAGMLKDLGHHLGTPVLLAACLIGGLNFFIFSNQYSYITYVLSEPPFSLPASLLGLLFLTYLSGTFGAAISGPVARKLPPPLCILAGIVLLMTGSLVTLAGSLSAIIGGLLINSFGFFLSHSMASSWVNRHAERARASASSLYLVFYYLGASAGGFYLDPFWRGWHWNGVVAGSLLVLMATASIACWLYRLEIRTAPLQAPL